MLKVYKYRIYPNSQQKELIEKTFSYCRLVFNLALETKIIAYKNAGVRLSAFDLCYQLAEMKQDYEWLNEVDSQALQASIKKVEIAFKNFFSGNGYPKFKSKHDKQSFQCPNNKREIDFKKGLLTIPKIHNIPIVISRVFIGKIKTVTISRVTTGKYFASILVYNEIGLPLKKPVIENTAIGIDLGIKHFAILSDGTKIDNPKYLRIRANRLKVLQRKISRKKKGSENRKKAIKKLAIHHEKITNQRNDFLHKLSTAIAKRYDTVCVEDLAVKNMVKNHNLAQAISEAGWSEFIRQIKYKEDWKGGSVFKFPRFKASSKPCNICGSINETLTLSDREWTCANCGTSHDRDINAATNIKKYFFKSGGGHLRRACGVVAKRQNYETGMFTYSP